MRHKYHNEGLTCKRRFCEETQLEMVRELKENIAPIRGEHRTSSSRPSALLRWRNAKVRTGYESNYRPSEDRVVGKWSLFQGGAIARMVSLIGMLKSPKVLRKEYMPGHMWYEQHLNHVGWVRRGGHYLLAGSHIVDFLQTENWVLPCVLTAQKVKCGPRLPKDRKMRVRMCKV